jgi:Zn-finger nucleic acid-binding protein
MARCETCQVDVDVKVIFGVEVEVCPQCGSVNEPEPEPGI